MPTCQNENLATSLRNFSRFRAQSNGSNVFNLEFYFLILAEKNTMINKSHSADPEGGINLWEPDF